MLKKINIIGIVLVAMLIAVGFAGAASSGGDQGRRLSGPFCVGKTNAGVNAGVVRSIAKTQPCRSYEIRKAGVAVPCKSVTVKLVPTNPCEVARGNPGTPGAAGPKGDTGVTGSQGAVGANGAPGAKGDTGSAGATGATGPQGAPGTNGTNGTNGLGDGTRWICKIGGGRGSLKDGGTGTNPDCNSGTDFAFKVVTSGAVNNGPFNGNSDD